MKKQFLASMVALALFGNATLAQVTPAPAITANGQKQATVVAANTPVKIDLTLKNAPVGSADWWIAMVSSAMPNTIFTFDLSRGWVPTITPALTGVLPDIPAPITLINEVMPAGDYVFLFGLDQTPDGQLTPASLVYDSVAVRVEKPVVAGGIPPELVGTWGSSSRTFHLNADGSYSSVSLYSDVGTLGCIVIRRMETANEGTFQVTGNSLVVKVTGGTVKTWNCNYDIAFAPNKLTQQSPFDTTYQWSISGNKLTLDDITYTKQ
jgi:hypothetical protein